MAQLLVAKGIHIRSSLTLWMVVQLIHLCLKAFELFVLLLILLLQLQVVDAICIDFSILVIDLLLILCFELLYSRLNLHITA